MSTILDVIPKDIEAIRLRLFKLDDGAITLSIADWNTYFPWVDNFWIRNKPAPQHATAEGTRTAYYWCRFHSTKDHVPTRSGTSKRNRSSRDAMGCGMKLKAVFHGEDFVEVLRHGECLEHVHIMEDADRIKKHSAIRQLAAEESTHGYKTSEVAANLRAIHRPADRKKLHGAGAHWLNLKDVHNQGAAYKAANPDVRLQGARYHWQEQREEARKWLDLNKVSLHPCYELLLIPLV